MIWLKSSTANEIGGSKNKDQRQGLLVWHSPTNIDRAIVGFVFSLTCRICFVSFDLNWPTMYYLITYCSAPHRQQSSFLCTFAWSHRYSTAEWLKAIEACSWRHRNCKDTEANGIEGVGIGKWMRGIWLSIPYNYKHTITSCSNMLWCFILSLPSPPYQHNSFHDLHVMQRILHFHNRRRGLIWLGGCICCWESRGQCRIRRGSRRGSHRRSHRWRWIRASLENYFEAAEFVFAHGSFCLLDWLWYTYWWFIIALCSERSKTHSKIVHTVVPGSLVACMRCAVDWILPLAACWLFGQ